MRTKWIAFMMIWICNVIPQIVNAENRCQSAQYAVLDFWIGEWDVYWDGELVGYNKIEKALNGCAVFEYWKDVRGGEGKSVFYFDLATANWKQVWITDSGSMKEKTLLRVNTDGGVIFQGRVTLLNEKTVLDRTTLHILKSEGDGIHIRHVIEQSEDEGKAWKTVFDGEYVPKKLIEE